MSCCSVTELRNKQVINQKNGCRLGYVNDVEIDCQNGRLVSLIIWGKWRAFGRRDDDIKIWWKDIVTLGGDTILVCGCERCRRERVNAFENIFK